MIMECTSEFDRCKRRGARARLVMQKGEPGRRYILGNTNLTLAGVLEILSELAGVPVPRLQVPYGLALSFAWFSEMWADRVSRRSPKATLTGVRLGRRIMHFDSSRTAAELGFAGTAGPGIARRTWSRGFARPASFRVTTRASGSYRR